MPAFPPMPSPFAAPPSDAMTAAAADAPSPGRGFAGRAGALIVRSADGKEVFYAFEPAARGMAASYTELAADTLWPPMKSEDVPHAELVRADGTVFTLEGLIREMFAAFPVRAPYQGGFEQERRRGHWRMALSEALRSPAVRLLAAFCREHAGHGADFGLELNEWWLGASPAHEMRFSGTFYPPCSAAKYLIDELSKGLAAEKPEPFAREGEEPEVPVLYEDEDLVVVNKPPRLASVPGIRESISAKSILEKERGPLRVVHRLDTDTSGVLLFAKNYRAGCLLDEIFRSGQAMKRYAARLEGKLSSPRGRIELPLALNLTDRPRQCVLPVGRGGREAATEYEETGTVTAPDGRIKSLVSLWLETGRTHQLRVHCAHAEGLGLPIDGDPFYGHLGLLGERRTTRLCLHAAELTLPHPTKAGSVVHVECEPDFPLF